MNTLSNQNGKSRAAGRRQATGSFLKSGSRTALAIGDDLLLAVKMRTQPMMKYKILGTIFVLAGLYPSARFGRHFIGLLFMVVGFYLAMKKGMKPL